MNAQHLTALREAAKALRKVKADIEAVLTAMENERTLLPERLWRTPVDDDMIETEVSMGELVGGLNDALESLTQIMGEDEPLEDNSPRYAPLPEVLPTHEQVDERRRAAARALRDRDADGGSA
jgi:hypothetical protein